MTRVKVKFTAPEQRLGGGFTLVELLVVLVLVALITGIAAPNIKAVYDNFQRDLARENLEKELTNLSFKAYLSGKEITLSDIKLPEGFSFSEDSELSIRPDGYCAGTRLIIESETERFMYYLNPPLCKPELLEIEDEI